MEERLWPETWEIITIIALYIMFNLSGVLQCVLHGHHPLLIGIYHCMQVTDSVLCAHHTCSISDIIWDIPLCRLQNSHIGIFQSKQVVD